eukprot:4319022-Lingulodinium_polyedra.AAC.1
MSENPDVVVKQATLMSEGSGVVVQLTTFMSEGPDAVFERAPLLSPSRPFRCDNGPVQDAVWPACIDFRRRLQSGHDPCHVAAWLPGIARAALGLDELG